MSAPITSDDLFVLGMSAGELSKRRNEDPALEQLAKKLAEIAVRLGSLKSCVRCGVTDLGLEFTGNECDPCGKLHELDDDLELAERKDEYRRGQGF